MNPQMMTFGQQSFYAEIKKVHKSEIVPGNTILLNGQLQTICRSNIKKGVDLTICGYAFGRERGMVDKVIIYRVASNGFVVA